MLSRGSSTRSDQTVVWLGVALLLVAAASKFWTLALQPPILGVLDPVWSVENRYLLAAVAATELICAVAVLSSSHWWFKGLVLAWLGANFLVYRVALHFSGSAMPCPCLGQLGAQFGLSHVEMEAITKGMLLYLLAAGAFLLIRHRPRAQSRPAVTSTQAPCGGNLLQCGEELN
jgi:hypothetical protein